MEPASTNPHAWWRQCPEEDASGKPMYYMKFINDNWFCTLCECSADKWHCAGKRHQNAFFYSKGLNPKSEQPTQPQYTPSSWVATGTSTWAPVQNAAPDPWASPGNSMYGAEPSLGAPITHGAPSTVPAHQQHSAEDLAIIIDVLARIQKDIASMHREIMDIKWHVAGLQQRKV